MTPEFLGVIAGFVAGAVISFISTFILKKPANTDTMEAELKQVILQLFLYAEKKGWTDNLKMDYVQSKIQDLIPGTHLDKVLAGDHLLTYLQSVYREFKQTTKKS